MKFFELASVFVLAQSVALPDEHAFYYGPITSVDKSLMVPIVEKCCSKFKVWSYELFCREFNILDEKFNNFPTFGAKSGGLKLFFNSKINKWTVSDNLSNEADIRAVGGSNSCPDSVDLWAVFNGKTFEDMDLTQLQVPYIKSNRFFECVPEEFSIKDLETGLSNTICNFIQSSKGVKSAKFCREAGQVVALTLADWDNSSNKLINSDLLLTANHTENIDQWHSILTTIIFRRSWEMDPQVTQTLQSYIAEFVRNLKITFEGENWTEDDSRFSFLSLL